MKSYALSVPANSSVRQTIAGTFVKVSRTDGAVTLRVSADGKTLSDRLEMAAGDKIKFVQPFDKVEVVNDTAAVVTATIIVGQGDHDSAGLVSVTSGSDFDSQADVTLANGNSQDYAASAVRKTFIFQGDAANSGDLRIRDLSGTTSEGLRLSANGVIVLDTSGPVRVRNNSGANQTYSVAVINQ